MVTDRPCTRIEAIPTPDSTTHHRWRSAYVMVISCDLSPSSATNTTARLTRVAVSIDDDLSTRRRRVEMLTARQASVEGLAHRLLRFAGRALRQYVDTTIGGYSPSLTTPTIAADVDDHASSPQRVRVPESSVQGSRINCFENPYAARSMAKIAVSGWLIGSTPTRLTIDVTVPSASASTHAARCSRPRWGRPGSSTQPDAAPEHSGSDGMVSDGGCSIRSAGG